MVWSHDCPTCPSQVYNTYQISMLLGCGTLLVRRISSTAVNPTHNRIETENAKACLLKMQRDDYEFDLLCFRNERMLSIFNMNKSEDGKEEAKKKLLF